MQKTTSFNNIAIVYVKGNAYRIYFWYMSKDDAINIMNGYNLADKRGVLKSFFVMYKKWVSATPLIRLIIKETEPWY